MEYKKFIFIIFIIIVFIYIIIKERQYVGCSNGFSLKKHCIDENSIPLIDTKIEENDNCYDMIDKLKYILSYHDRNVIWRKCSVISIIIICIIYYIYNITNNFNNIYIYILLFFVITMIIYLYNNYLNYHQYSILKKNGNEILKKIKNKCIIKQ
jgi:hypothetical protein